MAAEEAGHRRRTKRLQQVAFAVGVLVCAGWLAWSEHAQAKRQQAGAALFLGKTPLSARLVNHDEPLPAAATRCSNCHQQADTAPSSGNGLRSADARAYAGALDRARLTVPQQRRGGPASAYDLSAFCTVLRRGVDPAHVVISVLMPRYDIDDAQCVLQWSYLTSR